MVRIVKVHTCTSKEVREVTIQEAEKIVEDTLSGPVAGFVIDTKTGEVISQIGPNTEEILIIKQMGGG